MAPVKILLTGATGYVGGSLLTQLLQSTNPSIKNSKISVLVRGDAERLELFSDAGVTPIPFNSLDDLELLEKAASEHDVVIHSAASIHTGSAVAFIKGLAKHKAATGNDVKYIHTSGASSLGDRPITKTFIESREFLDTDPDIYDYLKSREAREVYHQRTTDLAVADTGKAVDVKTYIIMPPMIHGKGIGRIGNPNLSSIPIRILIRSAMNAGQAQVIGDGEGVCDYVHIKDLMMFYELFLVALLEENKLIPFGAKGIFFSSTNRYSWKALSQCIADVGHRIGALKTSQVRSIDLDTAAEWPSWGNSAFYAELSFAGNMRMKTVFGREVLGWVPQKTQQEYWEKGIEDDWRAIYGTGQ